MSEQRDRDPESRVGFEHLMRPDARPAGPPRHDLVDTDTLDGFDDLFRDASVPAGSIWAGP